MRTFRRFRCKLRRVRRLSGSLSDTCLVTLRTMWPQRKRDRLRPFDEATAYARCHGDRDENVRIVNLPPRRVRYDTVLSGGEEIRRGFEAKLDTREPDSTI